MTRICANENRYKEVTERANWKIFSKETTVDKQENNLVGIKIWKRTRI